tara:strand:- start:381 stop:620 length:240 start_codon:yes stop_codon:yes gene_type:complete
MTATAKLEIHRHAARRAILTVDFSNGGFILATIEIGRQYGGPYASDEFIRAALLKSAQSRATLEASSHGATLSAPVAWE